MERLSLINPFDEEQMKRIIDFENINNEKDLKTAKISLAKLKNRTRKRIIKLSINYTFNILGMEETFLVVSPQDKKILLYLEEHGFEYLGEENGSVIYLVEKNK